MSLKYTASSQVVLSLEYKISHRVCIGTDYEGREADFFF